MVQSQGISRKQQWNTLPTLFTTDTAAGKAHKPGGSQSPVPMLASFALRPQEGETNGGKGPKEKETHNVLSGSDELVTSQVASSIPTNLPSVKVQNNVLIP